MKKIYSLLLGAMVAAPALAQEEVDVTHLITNPGFDEDMTFLSDGSIKDQETDKSGSLSGRSHKWVSEDGTIYAASKTDKEGNGSWKRNDTEYSFNGFLGQIKGWELATGSNGEWTYFGAVPYSLNSGSTVVGIADDNNNSWLTVAGKPEEADTEANTATLYLRAGWTNYAEYTQVVKLPCAQYRLEYWINNMNFASTDASGLENRCEIICRKDHFPDTEGVNANGWEKHEIKFTPTAEFTIKMGFKSGNYGSGKNPILLIDGLKLFKIGEADKVELLSADLNDQVDSLNILSDDMFSDASGIAQEIEAKIEAINDAISEEDEDAMETCFKDMNAYITKLNTLPAKFDELGALVDKASDALENTEFPGIEAFQAAVDEVGDYIANGYESGDKEIAASDYIDVVIENLKKAINTYYESQEATPENPADFTHLVDNPTFAEQGQWYIGEGGGDQTIKTDKTDNEGITINCWNAWRNSMVEGNSVSVQQDLTGIKNGKYSITADINTQDGCITNQHLYVKSSIAEAESPVMTITGWDPCVWETLTSEPVIVVDGKLTIGAIGVSDGKTPLEFGGTDTDQRRGWFNLANVKLNYLGEATPEEIAEATAAKWKAADAYAENVKYGADKADYVKAVAEAKAANDFDALNEAIKEADASIADYESVTNGTLKTLADSTFASQNVNDIKKVVVDLTNNYINSAAATHTYTSVYTSTLQGVLNSLAPAIIKAEEAAAAAKAENAKAVLNVTISQVCGEAKSLKEIVPATSSSVIPTWVAELNKSIEVAAKADITIADGADVTAFMANPSIDEESGWTFNRAKGDKNSTTSQGIDGVSSNRYLDCWQAEAGTTRYTAYQTLNVPNGQYKIENIMRTSGAGAYLFASTDELVESGDAVAFNPAATNKLSLAVASTVELAKYGITPDSTETHRVFTDSRGEIWMGAADRIIKTLGVEVTPESSLKELVLEVTSGEETCPEGVDPLDWEIFKANDYTGRGWVNNSLEIEVKNHVLVVGVTCDSVLTQPAGGNPFTGTWFSADNFKLTLVKVGDNAGWDPTSDIVEVENGEATEPKSIYTVAGNAISELKKGINIVVDKLGKAAKVLVK